LTLQPLRSPCAGGASCEKTVPAPRLSGGRAKNGRGRGFEPPAQCYQSWCPFDDLLAARRARQCDHAAEARHPPRRRHVAEPLQQQLPAPLWHRAPRRLVGGPVLSAAPYVPGTGAHGRGGRHRRALKLAIFGGLRDAAGTAEVPWRRVEHPHDELREFMGAPRAGARRSSRSAGSAGYSCLIVQAQEPETTYTNESTVLGFPLRQEGQA